MVLVHGNPETEAIWDDLVPQIEERDVLRLSPPGFGAPIPEAFDCTIGSYREWLISELEKLAHPVDLLGHDWGGGHVMGVAMERPDLVRSWLTDILGLFDPDYVWHDLAQAWQTPDIGEQAVKQMMGLPIDDAVERYESLGMTRAVARKVLAARSPEMGRAILALYRSAAQPVMRDIGMQITKAAVRPGLALIPTEDHYCGGETLTRRSAERVGAQIAVLEGAGHWWMCQQPKEAAKAINRFLASLG
ncbi:alpha/beta fold hydrolase [Sulfitobacter sp. JBTF-M27]|uniref:Alpha/beta fold hydrolase n=1 Tax=Sulfitobacter sediminilitoris TaxID=2698830 RepID=A0A6P0CK91_9RHOB|nr:alpha/beta fold hydrolase [Sulfitobacter sediminilitoris]